MASLYVHIPFCQRKCPYCDFASVEDAGRIGDFLAALTREIALRDVPDGGATFETLFFGGGTPTLLLPGQLERILSHLVRKFRIAPAAEITLEANPGTVTEETLRGYRALGVNRLSLGVQSFSDRELRTLGRVHDRAAALRSLTLARAVGFDNIGLDLIYAIPGQALADWEATLATAADLAPQHIAAYGLTLEGGTPWARRVRRGEVGVAPASLQAAMYARAMERLAARGYEHYEVSSFARPGYRCQHNLAYWSHRNFLGLGPSAHSFWHGSDGRGGRRWWNVADLSAYLARLTGEKLPVASEEPIGARELVSERVLLGLRSGGLDLARLAADLGHDLEAGQGELIRWLVAAGMALRQGDTLRLTPRGYLVCDEICGRLLAAPGRIPPSQDGSGISP